MSIPCIDNKCLLYPICKRKKHIQCDKLFTYYKVNDLLTDEDKRNKFLMHFPKLTNLTKKGLNIGYFFLPYQRDYI